MQWYLSLCDFIYDERSGGLQGDAVIPSFHYGGLVFCCVYPGGCAAADGVIPPFITAGSCSVVCVCAASFVCPLDLPTAAGAAFSSWLL